jgi:hypothetical protein
MSNPDSSFYTTLVSIFANYIIIGFAAYFAFGFFGSRAGLFSNQNYNYYLLIVIIIVILGIVSFGLSVGSNYLYQSINCTRNINAVKNANQYVYAVAIGVFISAWKWPQIPVVSIYSSLNPTMDVDNKCCTLLKKYADIVNKYDNRVAMFKYTTLFYLFWSVVYGVVLSFGEVCNPIP